MFIGRATEMSRLREAILARRSLLVYGPAGSGKTALLEETLASLPSAVRKTCIVCDSCDSPKVLWRQLVQLLAEMHDSQVLSRVQRERDDVNSLDRWLDEQSSLRLRGILRHATRDAAYFVFIDSTAPLPAGVYRLLQEWVWSGCTPVFLLARGSTEHDLGRVARLYWHDSLRLELGSLLPEDAENLLKHAIARFRLAQLADAEFRAFVLKQSACLPGGILRLCELGSQSAYHYNGHLKLHTLAIDFQMQIQGELRTRLRANLNG
jgi:hypothetical protein